MAPDGVVDIWNYSLIFWEIVTAAVIVVAVLLVVLAFRHFVRGGSRAAGSGRQILDERYARGEIGRDEYEQKRRDLVS